MADPYKSEYLKVGALVSFRGQRSSATIHNVTILEIFHHGFVGTQKGIKNGPVRLFQWHEVDDFVFVSDRPVATITQKSGRTA